MDTSWTLVLRDRLTSIIPIHIYTVLDISHWILHELDWKRIWQSSVSRTPRYTARGNAICESLIKLTTRLHRFKIQRLSISTFLPWQATNHRVMMSASRAQLCTYYIPLFETPTLYSFIAKKMKNSIDRSLSINRFPFDCNRLELLTLDILYFFTKHSVNWLSMVTRHYFRV